jgi:HTH-type transcriptional regulator/antitoxin HigA
MEEVIMRKTFRKAAGRDTYFALVRKFPLKPIRSEGEYDQAVVVMEKLAVRGEQGLDGGERDYLEVLGRLITDFDRNTYPTAADTRTPTERLRDLMADHGMNVSAVGRIIGSQPAASMILHGKRQISRAQARMLAEHFRLDAGYFI